MSIGFLFWLLMILWIVFGAYSTWPGPGAGRAALLPFGGSLLLWILLALLGWHDFGFPVHG